MGDSKAILCEKGESLVLTVNHNPYIKSEYDRIIKNYGRVQKD